VKKIEEFESLKNFSLLNGEAGKELIGESLQNNESLKEAIKDPYNDGRISLNLVSFLSWLKNKNIDYFFFDSMMESDKPGDRDRRTAEVIQRKSQNNKKTLIQAGNLHTAKRNKNSMYNFFTQKTNTKPPVIQFKYLSGEFINYGKQSFTEFEEDKNLAENTLYKADKHYKHEGLYLLPLKNVKPVNMKLPKAS